MMARKATTTPQNHTPDKRQLAALSNILGLMMTAARLSEELYALSDKIGASLEEVADTAGVPFFEIHNAYVRQRARKEPRGGKKAVKAQKRSKAA